jgi:BlaI family penicillinase repressor
MKETAWQPSDAEIEILQVLWDHEPATVRFVHEQLSAKKEVGYTTTLKQMQRMYEKGMLLRTESGKTHYYTTEVKAPQVRQTAFSHLLEKVFNGSAIDLLLHAIGQGQPKPEEIEALEKLIQEKKKQHNNE